MKIPSFYSITYQWNTTTITKGESVIVTMTVKATEDNKHVLIQVDDNDDFCLCGFTMRKIKLEVGEEIAITYTFISLHAGICSVPTPKFIRNNSELHVDYENTVPPITKTATTIPNTYNTLFFITLFLLTKFFEIFLLYNHTTIES